MELIEKIFRGTDAEGNANDLSDEKDMAIIIDGKDNGIKLEHVFRKYALNEDDGAIYGTSLLSYFTPKDGKLVDAEGHTVEFLTSDRKPFLIIDNMEEPFLDDDAEIDIDYVKAFSELIGINKPDVIFADLLNDDEKEMFASERRRKEADAKKKADDEAKQKEDEELKKKQADEDAKKQADAEARAKVNPDYFVDEAKYTKHQKFYSNLQTFKEYIDGNVHLFYGNKWKDYDEDPFVLVKSGDDWWEDVETDVENIKEDDKTIELEYKDGEVWKKVVLDVATDTISVAEIEKE
jgi:hypothetical protein